MSEKDLLLIEKLERQQLLLTENFQKEIKEIQAQIDSLKNPEEVICDCLKNPEEVICDCVTPEEVIATIEEVIANETKTPTESEIINPEETMKD